MNMRKIKKCQNCNEVSEIHAKKLCFKCYRKQWKPPSCICKHCGRKRPHQAKGMCASCFSKVYHYDNIKNSNYRRYHNIPIELYKKVTKKCIICGFDKIVDLHHLDHNKNNKSKSNLIGLCPNHHKLLHDYRFSEEVAKELKEKGLNPKITYL